MTWSGLFAPQVQELRLSSELATKALAQLVTEFPRVEAVDLDGGEKVEVEVLAALQKLPSLRRLTIQVCGAPTCAWSSYELLYCMVGVSFERIVPQRAACEHCCLLVRSLAREKQALSLLVKATSAFWPPVQDISCYAVLSATSDMCWPEPGG